jgi:hypothetical protein
MYGASRQRDLAPCVSTPVTPRQIFFGKALYCQWNCFFFYTKLEVLRQKKIIHIYFHIHFLDLVLNGSSSSFPKCTYLHINGSLKMSVQIHLWLWTELPSVLKWQMNGCNQSHIQVSAYLCSSCACLSLKNQAKQNTLHDSLPQNTSPFYKRGRGRDVRRLA